MVKAEPAAEALASSRRSNRATTKPAPTKSEEPTKTSTAPKAKATVAKKTAPTTAAAKKAAKAAEPTTTTTTATDASNGTVKRKVGRPLGSTKKKAAESATVKAADSTTKVPGRRGRKPKNATATATATAAPAIEKQVSNLEVKPKKGATQPAKDTDAAPSKRGRKRKADADDATAASAASAAKKTRTTGETTDKVPGKRGRPAGSGKKQKQAASAAAKAGGVSSAQDKDDTEGDFNGIKLTIERCTTCTQYHKNVTRIFKVAKELYPHALFHEEVVPNSKSFEIYLSKNGSKNKLIWSGKAHAPPKRLAFPDSDVFVDLLKAEFKDK
ncbi:hypothetical protein BGZ72_006818 [Mortierella alpina]|nr:hypothetical protein BGZ72_006818 [Mortierella alpina]